MLDITHLKTERRALESEMEVVSKLVKKSLCNPVFPRRGEASSDYVELIKRFENQQKWLSNINAEIVDKKQRTTAIRQFYYEISKAKGFTEFSHR